MTSAQIIITATIVLYLGAMVFVGVYFGKKGSGASCDDGAHFAATEIEIVRARAAVRFFRLRNGRGKRIMQQKTRSRKETMPCDPMLSSTFTATR